MSPLLSNYRCVFDYVSCTFVYGVYMYMYMYIQMYMENHVHNTLAIDRHKKASNDLEKAYSKYKMFNEFEKCTCTCTVACILDICFCVG